MIKDRVIIVDGINLFIRHYAAHPAMSENGEQTGGIVGFFNNLTRLIARCRPESVYIIWEGGGSKKKRDLFKDYKRGGRPLKLNRYYEDIPDTNKNRNYQIQFLIKLLNCFPVCQLFVEDAEADDIIGYLCKYKLKRKNKIIVSSDHDYYQLIDKDVLIWSPTLKAFVDTSKVIERYGVHPINFCLAKSIVGDKSDNIPGVNRAGYKTLVKKYPSLSNSVQYYVQDIINMSKEMINEGKAIKVINEIYNSKKLIERNYKLVLLDMNNLSHFQVEKINQKLENFCFSWKNMDAYKLLRREGIRGIDIFANKYVFKNLNQEK